MSEMTIGEVAQKTGTPASTLRYYESIGLLPAPQRINGRRHYSDSIVLQIKAIHRARDAGWTLAEIKQLLYGFSEEVPYSTRWKAMAPQKIEEIDALLRRTRQMKELLQRGIDCNCKTLEECEAI